MQVEVRAHVRRMLIVRECGAGENASKPLW
jgi:hypothetical protein